MTEPVSEERRKAYVEKARKGVLVWLATRDGAAPRSATCTAPVVHTPAQVPASPGAPVQGGI